MTPAAGRPPGDGKAAQVADRAYRTLAGLALGFAFGFFTLGCRGKLSTQPPRMLFRDMHDQPSLRPETQVPDEIGIVGYDGNEAFDFFYAPITIVEQPLNEIGTKSVNTLISLMNDPDKIVRFDMSHSLNIRKSSR